MHKTNQKYLAILFAVILFSGGIPASALPSSAPQTLQTSSPDPFSILASWLAPADDGGQNVTSYRIEYESTGLGNWTTFGTVSTNGTGSANETITGLIPDSDYNVRVFASNIDGESVASSNSSTTTQATAPLDSDGDGILDQNDSCPSQPETFNGFEDADGCPDTVPSNDNDGDGILNPSDSCPDDPETFNGFEDSDGCPDTAPVSGFPTAEFSTSPAESFTITAPVGMNKVESIRTEQHYTERFSDGNPDTLDIFITDTAVERLADYDGEYKAPYYKTEDASMVQVETPEGSYVWDKTFCALTFYNGERITENSVPVIGSDSFIFRGAVVGTDNWVNLDNLNNASCFTEVFEDGTNIEIRGTKTSAGEAEATIRYIKLAGQLLKPQLEVTNLNPAWTNHKLSILETIHMPDNVKLGDTVYSLPDNDGTFVDRAWIQAHGAQFIELTDKVHYEVGLGWDLLWGINVLYENGQSKLVFDYSNTELVILPNETLILDPRYGDIPDASYHVAILDNNDDDVCETSPSSFGRGTVSIQIAIADAGTGALDCTRVAFEWTDFTAIPKFADITNVNFVTELSSSTAGARVCDIYAMANQPSLATDSALWTDIADGTVYVNDSALCLDGAEGTNIVFDLGSTALTDFKTAFQAGTFYGIGFKYDDETGTAEDRRTNFDEEGTPKPTLRVTYTVPVPDPPTELTASLDGTNMTLTSTAGNLNVGTNVGTYYGLSKMNDTTYTGWTPEPFPVTGQALVSHLRFDGFNNGLLDWKIGNVTKIISTGINQTISTDGLLVDFEFDTPTYPNTIANVDGTSSGDPTSVSGVLGNAVSYDGTGDWHTLSTDKSKWVFLHDGSDFSISWWMKLNAGAIDNGDNQSIFGTSVGGTDVGTSFYFEDGSSDHGLRLRMENAGPQSQIVTTNNYVPKDSTTWYHYITTYTGSTDTWNVYRDNANNESNTDVMTQSSADHTSNMFIGQSTAFGSIELDAQLDEIAFFDKVISSAQRAQLYNSGSGARADSITDSSGLVAYYDMDQKSSTIINVVGRQLENQATLESVGAVASPDDSFDTYSSSDRNAEALWGTSGTDLIEDFITCTTNTCDGAFTSTDLAVVDIDTVTNKIIYLADRSPLKTDSFTFDLDSGGVGDAWTMRLHGLNGDFTSSTSIVVWIGVSDNTAESNASQDFAGIQWGMQNGVDFGFRSEVIDSSTPVRTNTQHFLLSESTDYFVEISSDGNNLTVSVFSDSNFTNLLSVAVEDISALTNLRYFKIQGDNLSGSTEEMTVLIDKIEFWDATHTIAIPDLQQTADFTDDFSTSTNWVEVGNGGTTISGNVVNIDVDNSNDAGNLVHNVETISSSSFAMDMDFTLVTSNLNSGSAYALGGVSDNADPTNNDSLIFEFLTVASTRVIRIAEWIGGAEAGNTNGSFDLPVGVTYYVSGRLLDSTTAQMTIYSDSDRTAVIETINLTITANTWTHLIIGSAFAHGGGTATIDIDNFNFYNTIPDSREWANPWTTVDETEMYVDLDNQAISFYENGGTDITSITTDIGLVDEDNWTLTYKLDLTTLTEGGDLVDSILFIGLTDTDSTVAFETTGQDAMGIAFHLDSGKTEFNDIDINSGNLGAGSTLIVDPMLTGVYYVKQMRIDGINSILNLYSDSNYSNVVYSNTKNDISTSTDNLQYFKISGRNIASADSIIAGLVSDVKFYNTISVLGSIADGAIVDATTGLNGIRDQAYSFDGTNDYISTGNWNTVDDITINYWIKPNTCAGTHFGYIATDRWDIAGMSDCQIRWHPEVSNALDTVELITVDQWNMITAVQVGSTSREIYINGELTTHTTESGSPETVTSDIGTDTVIGHTGVNVRGYFDGEFDDVYIFNRALTQSEISTYYNLGRSIDAISGVGQSGGTISDVDLQVDFEFESDQIISSDSGGTSTHTATGDESGISFDTANGGGGFGLRVEAGHELIGKYLVDVTFRTKYTVDPTINQSVFVKHYGESSATLRGTATSSTLVDTDDITASYVSDTFTFPTPAIVQAGDNILIMIPNDAHASTANWLSEMTTATGEANENWVTWNDGGAFTQQTSRESYYTITYYDQLLQNQHTLESVGAVASPDDSFDTYSTSDRTANSDNNMSTDPFTTNDAGALSVTGGVAEYTVFHDNSNNAMVIPLGFTASTNAWKLDYDFKVTGQVSSYIFLIGLSSEDETTASSGTEDFVAFRADVAGANTQAIIDTTSAVLPSASNDDTGAVAFVTDRQYYNTLELHPDLSYYHTIFSDSDRTIIIDKMSGTTTSAKTDALQYIKLSNRITSAGGTGTFDLDNIKFYDATHTIAIPDLQQVADHTDLFTSDLGWDSDSGTELVLDDTVDNEYDNIADGAGDNHDVETSIDPLGTTFTNNIVTMRFEWEVEAVGGGTTGALQQGILLDADETNPFSTGSRDTIYFGYFVNSGGHHFTLSGSNGQVPSSQEGSGDNTSGVITPTAGTSYFVELGYDATTLTATIYSDSEFTTVLDVLTKTQTATDLRYIKNYQTTTSSNDYTSTHHIKNIQLFDGISDAKEWGNTWIAVDESKFYVDLDSQAISFNHDTTTDDYTIYQDVGLLTDQWTLRFDIDFTTLTGDANNFLHVGLSDTIGSDDVAQDMLYVIVKYEAVDQKWEIGNEDGAVVNANPSVQGIVDGVALGKYYLEFIRTSPTEIILNVFSDSGYTNLIETIIKSDIQITIDQLRYLKVQNRSVAGAGEIVGVINNIQIYDTYALLGGSVNGAILGATTGVSGKHLQAFDFDGTDDYISIAQPVTFDNSDYTISAWFNLDDQSANHPIICSMDTDNEQEDFCIYSESTHIRAQKRTDNTTIDSDFVDTTSTVQIGVWHHVAFVYDDSVGQSGGNYLQGAMKIYLDGVLSDDTALDGSFTGDSPLSANIGKDGSLYMNGKIDDVKVYHRVLSDAEISTLAESFQVSTGTFQEVAPIFYEFDGTSVNHNHEVDNNASTLGDGVYDAVGIHLDTSSSALIGVVVNDVSFKLDKTGSPTGTLTFGVFDETVDDTTLLHNFGTLDVETLTGSALWYTRDTGSYTLSESEVIGMTYTGGDGSNKVNVSLEGTSSTYDSTDSVATRLATSGVWANIGFDYDVTFRINSVLQNIATPLNYGETVLYSDDFDTDDYIDQHSANIGVDDVTNERLDFDIKRDNTNDATSYNLGSIICVDNNGCQWRYKLDITSFTELATTVSVNIGIGNSPSSVGSDIAQDYLGLEIQVDSGGNTLFRVAHADDEDMLTEYTLLSFAEAVATGTFYIDNKLSGEQFTVCMYSDPSYSVLLECKTLGGITASGFDEFIVKNIKAGAGTNSALIGSIDDIILYDIGVRLADGTNDEATTGVAGIRDEAYTFDGVDDFIDTNMFVDITDSIHSWSFWAKQNTVNSDHEYAVSNKNTGNDGFGIGWNSDEDFEMILEETGTGDFATCDVTPPFVLDQWTHYVVVYDGTSANNCTSMTFYINGVDTAITTSVSGTITDLSSDKTMQLSRQPSPTKHFDGELDDFVYFSGIALTSSQAQQLYNGGNSMDVIEAYLGTNSTGGSVTTYPYLTLQAGTEDYVVTPAPTQDYNPDFLTDPLDFGSDVEVSYNAGTNEIDWNFDGTDDNGDGRGTIDIQTAIGESISDTWTVDFDVEETSSAEGHTTRTNGMIGMSSLDTYDTIGAQNYALGYELDSSPSTRDGWGVVCSDSGSQESDGGSCGMLGDDFDDADTSYFVRLTMINGDTFTTTLYNNAERTDVAYTKTTDVSSKDTSGLRYFGFWDDHNNGASTNFLIGKTTEIIFYNGWDGQLSKIAGSVIFDGSTFYTTATEIDSNYDALTLLSDHTVTFWYNPQLSGALQGVISKADSGDGNKGYQLFMDATENLTFALDGGTNALVCETTDPITTNVFQHFAVVYDYTSGNPDCNMLRIYVDDVSVSIDTLTETATTSDTILNNVPFSIGSFLGATADLVDGSMLDDVRFYSIGLTPLQVSNLYGYDQISQSPMNVTAGLIPIIVGEDYGIRSATVNENGQSGWTTIEYRAEIGDPPDPPDPPSTCTTSPAECGNAPTLDKANGGVNLFDLSWSITNGTGVTSYRVENSTDSITWELVESGIANGTTSYTNGTGFADNQSNYWRVFGEPYDATNSFIEARTIPNEIQNTTKNYPDDPTITLVELDGATPQTFNIFDIEFIDGIDNSGAYDFTGGSPIKDYAVRADNVTDATGWVTWVTNATIVDGTGSIHIHNQTSLLVNSTWNIQIRLGNLVDWSPWSENSTSTNTTFIPTVAPANLFAVPVSDSQIDQTWTGIGDADDGGSVPADYGIRYVNNTAGDNFWTTLVASSSIQVGDGSLHYNNHTSINAGMNHTYQVRESNIAGWSPWSDNSTASVFEYITAILTASETHSGDAIVVNGTWTMLTGVDSTFTIEVISHQLVNDTSAIQTVVLGTVPVKGQEVTIPFMYMVDLTTNPHTVKLRINIENSTGIFTFDSPVLNVTPTYDAVYSASIEGSYSVNYTHDRSSSGTVIELAVNRLDAPFQVECNFRSELFGDGNWVNETVLGWYNVTQNVEPTRNVYIQCYNDELLFTTVSFGETNATLSLVDFTDQLGTFFGVPIPFLFVIFLGAIFTGRSAPTGIIFMTASIGVMGLMGYFPDPVTGDNLITATVWGMLILVTALGLFMGKRFF